MQPFSRRRILTGAASMVGAAWMAPGQARAQNADPEGHYAAIEGEPFPVPAINLSRIRPGYLRTAVDYDTTEKPGTIVIDVGRKYLYLVGESGQAIRYGVGVGRQGFAWSGIAHIQAKREWPDWYPPKEMLARDHSIMQVMSQLQSGIGMPGGPGNPLGARAMYLYQGNKDTLYRIHGTVEPWTIGSNVSSGCIRMINQDAIDLYSRVALGTKVVVEAAGGVRPISPDEDTASPVPQARIQPAPAYGQQPGYGQQPFGQQPGSDPYDPYGFDRGDYGQ